jgi:hypothetical protein
MVLKVHAPPSKVVGSFERQGVGTVRQLLPDPLHSDISPEHKKAVPNLPIACFSETGALLITAPTGKKIICIVNCGKYVFQRIASNWLEVIVHNILRVKMLGGNGKLRKLTKISSLPRKSGYANQMRIFHAILWSVSKYTHPIFLIPRADASLPSR